MKIDFSKIQQHVISMHLARDAGMFADSPNDWEQRPDGELYVYTYNGDVIGYVDGEEAIFSTLAEFIECYADWIDRGNKKPTPVTRAFNLALTPIVKAAATLNDHCTNHGGGFYVDFARSGGCRRCFKARVHGGALQVTDSFENDARWFALDPKQDKVRRYTGTGYITL